MSDSKSQTPDETKQTPSKGPSASAESPTTARELDFDDEPQELGVVSGEPGAAPGAKRPSGAARAVSGDEKAPPKPPRPLSPQQQAENTLKEAFPSIDAAVVRAVLTASGGKVEPAFNALLGMSDPDSQKETPPPQPPRPTQSPLGATSTKRSQLEADELYARQLAEHYSASSGYGSRDRGDPPMPGGRRESNLKPNELYDDRDHSFFDDDLPVIRENIRKGFLETQSKVNKWVADFKKKIDGEEEDEEFQGRPPAQGYRDSPRQSYGIRPSGELNRRSGDRDRYDADPRVLGDDFAALELRDEEGNLDKHPSKSLLHTHSSLAAAAGHPLPSSRPLANPNLFKPTPRSPPQSGPVDEVDAAFRTQSQAKRPTNTAEKASKWQPLTSIDPSPVADDPFSLGDSDDEREAKTKDLKGEDSERLKRAAAEAMNEDIGSSSGSSGKKLEPHQKTGSQGTKDKEAEEVLNLR
ncbi:MAG: hypothetical protein M1819_002047 [Sarea resinae]|nr:MAG: hypothetical protein M1819_002047 [Sarea resinae]